jgi:hypothetical protein
VKDFVGTLANFIQVAGWVVPALSTVTGLLKSFGLNSDGNVSIVQQLQGEFDRVILANHGDLEMLHIAEILATERSGLENITDSPKLPPSLFVPGEDLKSVTEAKNKLTDRAFWTRPFVSAAVFTVPLDTTIATWFSATPPREVDHPDRVFDPSLSLPALLSAIEIYSAATTALAGIDGGGSLPQPFKDHLNELAASLDAFHREIARGIVDLRIPTRSELVVLDDPPGSFFQQFGSPFGAAFLYSNRHIVDEYPLVEDFPDLPRTADFLTNYPLFLARFKLGNIARKKALYILLKLHETWETIQHLRRAAQTTPDVVDPFHGWSVSEIARALEESFPPDPNQLQSGVSIGDLMGKLRKLVVPPVDGDLGFRALLTRVTP